MRHFVLLLVALCVGLVSCTNGVTVRNAVKDFSCFKQNHYIYAMVRAYLNIGKVDPNARDTLIAADKARLLYTDVYINPCVDCKMMPEEQVKQVIEALKGTNYGTIHVMVQLMDKWTANTTYNCEYVNRMVNEIKKNSKDAGIGSDAPVWKKVMGHNCEIQAEYVSCWWQKHDKEQSLSHFKPFGGFAFPTIKEFDGPVKMCGHEVDLNFCNC